MHLLAKPGRPQALANISDQLLLMEGGGVGRNQERGGQEGGRREMGILVFA